MEVNTFLSRIVKASIHCQSEHPITVLRGNAVIERLDAMNIVNHKRLPLHMYAPAY